MSRKVSRRSSAAPAQVSARENFRVNPTGLECAQRRQFGPLSERTAYFARRGIGNDVVLVNRSHL
jgi:hypothetical protein